MEGGGVSGRGSGGVWEEVEGKLQSEQRAVPGRAGEGRVVRRVGRPGGWKREQWRGAEQSEQQPVRGDGCDFLGAW